MTKRKTASKLAEEPRVLRMMGLLLDLLGIREAERDGRVARSDTCLLQAPDLRYHPYFSDLASALGYRSGKPLYIE